MTDLKCPICLNSIIELNSTFICLDEAEPNTTPTPTITLKCGHLTCLPCYENVLKFLQSPSCPICRQPIETHLSITMPVDDPITTNSNCSQCQPCLAWLIGIVMISIILVGVWKGVITL